jgi:hypothetical protein
MTYCHRCDQMILPSQHPASEPVVRVEGGILPRRYHARCVTAEIRAREGRRSPRPTAAAPMVVLPRPSRRVAGDLIAREALRRLRTGEAATLLDATRGAQKDNEELTTIYDGQEGNGR